MSQVKLEIKRLENNNSRQVTFSKHRNGLIKKAYELSVLCDIDLALIMFSPSGHLTQFSGKRIEDVFTRFINLPDQETVSATSSPYRDTVNSRNLLESREYLINTLNQLRTEDEVAPHQQTRYGTTESYIEELIQEIGRLHQQLDTAEDQLSVFKPDLSNMTSLEELESCEKQLEDTLTTITERKKYLLNNHASTSSYSPSCMQEMQLQMPTFLESQNVASWVPHHGQNHGQMFDASVPYIPIRDISFAVYNPILQGSSSNIDQRVMWECQINRPDNENLPAWHHTYGSTDPYPCPSHILPPHLFIPIQGMEEPGMATATPHDQAEVTSKSSVAQLDTEAANYEGEPVTKLVGLTGIRDRG